MTVIVVCIIGYALFRVLGPRVDKLLIPEEERLETKREQLREATRRREVLDAEVGVTREQIELDGEIASLKEELKELGG
jgi:hypothetical protein